MYCVHQFCSLPLRLFRRYRSLATSRALYRICPFFNEEFNFLLLKIDQRTLGESFHSGWSHFLVTHNTAGQDELVPLFTFHGKEVDDSIDHEVTFGQILDLIQTVQQQKRASLDQRLFQHRTHREIDAPVLIVSSDEAIQRYIPLRQRIGIG